MNTKANSAKQARGHRIALFTANYDHLVDGVALTLNRLVQYLEDRGHEVLVFSPRTKHPALQGKGTIHYLPALPLIVQPEYRIAYRIPKSSYQKLDRFNPDLIHIASPDYIAHLAIQYARENNIPVVSSFHSNIASYCRYSPILKALEPAVWWYFRKFYGRCDHVYVPTPSMAEELGAHGIDREVRIWGRGVDLNRFSTTKRENSWRLQLGLSADDQRPLVLFVARLRWEKGLRLLADILLELERRNIPHQSMIVGDGVGRSWLQQQLPNTKFTGHLVGDSLARTYANADIFLYPSATETFGNVILEAMASGLPAICANAPGSRSVAQSESTAFLVQDGDTLAFVDAVQRLIQNPELRQQMATAARKRAESFTWNHAMAQLLKHYEDVLNPEFT